MLALARLNDWGDEAFGWWNYMEMSVHAGRWLGLACFMSDMLEVFGDLGNRRVFGFQIFWALSDLRGYGFHDLPARDRHLRIDRPSSGLDLPLIWALP